MTTADPRWLGDSELEAWLPFSALLLKLPSALDAQLKRESQLSFFGYLVLAALSEAPDRTLRMSDLSALANGSLSRLSHAVSALERRGFVERLPSATDRRITFARLTDDGHEAIVAAAPAHVATVRKLVVDALGAARFAELGRMAQALLEAGGDEYGTPTFCDLASRSARSGR